jgi:hypothetical protein
MNENHKATLRIHGPVDLLSAVPYLLGFQPKESLVLIGLTRSMLVVTARMDLDDAAEQDGYIVDTVATMVRGGSRQFVTVIFTHAEWTTDVGMPYANLAATVR